MPRVLRAFASRRPADRVKAAVIEPCAPQHLLDQAGIRVRRKPAVPGTEFGDGGNVVLVFQAGQFEKRQRRVPYEVANHLAPLLQGIMKVVDHAQQQGDVEYLLPVEELRGERLV